MKNINKLSEITIKLLSHPTTATNEKEWYTERLLKLQEIKEEWKDEKVLCWIDFLSVIDAIVTVSEYPERTKED